MCSKILLKSRHATVFLKMEYVQDGLPKNYVIWQAPTIIPNSANTLRNMAGKTQTKLKEQSELVKIP